MQKYLNPVNNQQWHFDLDVTVQGNQFFDARGNRLNVPETLIPLPEGWAPPEPEPVIPQSVTPAQGLMALYAIKGITEDDILAAIGTIEDPTLRYQALISYKKATVWERPSVSMQVVAGLLALTEPDQDELFTLAATYANL